MPPRAEHLSSLNGLGLKWNKDDETLECTTPHALTRAAGYLKHVRGQRGERVLFRGQTENWKPCVPSLFRPKPGQKLISQDLQSARMRSLCEYLKEARTGEAFIRWTKYRYDFAHEAILQHYGIKTGWLDVVDNVWVALWFAVNTCVPARDNGTQWHFTASDKPHGYILLMSPGEDVRSVEGSPGLAESRDCELIDLRVAAPSLYVRPHAQHGLLFRRKSYPPRKVSLDSCVVGIIKIRTEIARAWLGAGFLQAPHVLFPPPHYDAGYSRLLEKAPEAPCDIGGLATVFP